MAGYHNQHNRRSIRLLGYDYTQLGAYFVTLVTHERKCLFGGIMDGQIKFSPLGRIAEEQWLKIHARFPSWEIDAFVIMPNHTHGVLIKRPLPGAAPEIKPGTPDGSLRPYVTTDSLGAVMRSYKSAVAFRYHQSMASLEVPLWQRNYYEHIIRDDEDLDRIRLYILENRLRWADDEENIRRL